MIYISCLAAPSLKSYLSSSGFNVCEVYPEPRLGMHIAAHPDLVICKTGVSPECPCIFADRNRLRAEYPLDAAYCAVFLDKYLIHRLDITAPELLRFAEEHGLSTLNVHQGYTKCSCVTVTGNAVITSDPGIADVLSKTEIDVLKIRPGYVSLPGFEYGFLGGASGRVGGEILFNGDLSSHPDFNGISDFITGHGLGVRYFPDFPLTDTGSVIECP